MQSIDFIRDFAFAVACMVILTFISATVIWKAIWIVKRRKENDAGKEVVYCTVATVFVVIVSVIVFPLAHYNLNLYDFKERILNHCEAVSEVKFHSTPPAFQIIFYVDSNLITFDVVEEYFQNILDEFQDPIIFKSITGRGKMDRNFGLWNIEIVFSCEGSTIYSFLTSASSDYTGWRVTESREPEYHDKEYYREIALEPPVRSDVGSRFI